MTWYQILCLIGVPSLCVTIVTCFFKKINKVSQENAALKAGVQALLRAQMIDDYNHYKERGTAPIYAKENFQNCWVQYETLGKNGVMQGIHDEFMSLPTE